MSMIRTRWAAVGAAVAVSLGAGGIGISSAMISSGEKPVYKPIEPCRLADLRPAPNTVGPRSTPLGPNETFTWDGWGTIGNCTLPSGTAGLALNVTAVNASQPTDLRFFPAGSALPTASNLNPVPGQPPTPNAVNVDLSDAGEFSVLNRFGSVNVLIDVVGYYEDHNHDDRYYPRADVDSALGDKANAADVYTMQDVDDALDDKAEVADVYTKQEVDSAIDAATPPPVVLHVDGDGTNFLAQGATAVRSGLGTYTVTVAQNLSPCIPIASTYWLERSIVVFKQSVNTVIVDTYDFSGAKADAGFYLTIVCQ